jgi:hypothetical protein
MSEEKIVFTRPKRQTKSFAERNHDYLLLLVVVGICGVCGLIGAFLIFSVTKPPVAKTEDPPLMVSSGVPAEGYEDNFAFMSASDVSAMTPSTRQDAATLMGILYASIEHGRTPELPNGCYQIVDLESLNYEMSVNANLIDALHFYEIWTNLRPRALLRAKISKEDFITAYAVLPTLKDKNLALNVACSFWTVALVAKDDEGHKSVRVEILPVSN